VDDIQVANGVDLTLNVNDLLVVEDSKALEDTIHCTNVGKEGIAKPFSSMRVTYESSDVGDLEAQGSVKESHAQLTYGKVGRHFLGRLEVAAKSVKSVIRDSAATLVRVDGAEREVLRRDGHVGEDIEHSRLADIRQTNNTHLQVVARSPQQHLCLWLLPLLAHPVSKKVPFIEATYYLMSARFHKKIAAQLLQERETLLVIAEGLGLEEILMRFMMLYSGEKKLVFVLQLEQERQVQVRCELQAEGVTRLPSIIVDSTSEER
jgi:hypothetical protein